MLVDTDKNTWTKSGISMLLFTIKTPYFSHHFGFLALFTDASVTTCSEERKLVPTYIDSYRIEPKRFRAATREEREEIGGGWWRGRKAFGRHDTALTRRSPRACRKRVTNACRAKEKHTRYRRSNRCGVRSRGTRARGRSPFLPLVRALFLARNTHTHARTHTRHGCGRTDRSSRHFYVTIATCRPSNSCRPRLVIPPDERSPRYTQHTHSVSRRIAALI